jgi:hypothetical protein
VYVLPRGLPRGPKASRRRRSSARATRAPRGPGLGTRCYTPVDVDVGHPLAVANPVLVIEITSPSTEDYDRGEKLRHYKSLPSLREVLFVSHRAPHLTLHRRGDPDWTVTTAETGAVLDLASVGARIAVDEVYRDGLEDAG